MEWGSQAVGLGLGIILDAALGSFSEKKGYSFWLGFFLGFFLTPLLGVLIILCLRDKNAQSRSLDADEEEDCYECNYQDACIKYLNKELQKNVFPKVANSLSENTDFTFLLHKLITSSIEIKYIKSNDPSIPQKSQYLLIRACIQTLSQRRKGQNSNLLYPSSMSIYKQFDDSLTWYQAHGYITSEKAVELRKKVKDLYTL